MSEKRVFCVIFSFFCYCYYKTTNPEKKAIAVYIFSNKSSFVWDTNECYVHDSLFTLLGLEPVTPIGLSRSSRP